jgi:hypothetical protein
MHRLIMIALALVLVPVLSGCCALCNLSDTGISRGERGLATEARAVSGYRRITLSGSGAVEVVQNGEEGVVVEAQAWMLPYVRTEVQGDTLVLGVRNIPWRLRLRPIGRVTYRVSVDELERLNASGSGRIAAGEIDSDDLTVGLSGSGRILIEALQADELDVTISGSGRIRIGEGEVERQIIHISGSGEYEADALESESARATVSGSGDATIWVTDELDAAVSGSGNIRYYGSPAVSEHKSGSGDIVPLDGR